ncbi:hypothetical protein DM867_13090 [Halosegnis rubeus]|uniref:Uncharacterized protein n=1 Tax=Halosegnis rubeus TaxID=2212850 RepID=A0A5N5U1K1_9EURY|nr:hypothetical protein [Halosegnis rubeus]KAB7512440.1 hypothetical protein DM867_13090 [Halosegnis rubeus]
MNTRHTDDDGRIADDYTREHSPSCGYAEIPERMDCPNAHTVDTAELDAEADDDPEVLEVSYTMSRQTTTTLEVAL